MWPWACLKIVDWPPRYDMIGTILINHGDFRGTVIFLVFLDLQYILYTCSIPFFISKTFIQSSTHGFRESLPHTGHGSMPMCGGPGAAALFLFFFLWKKFFQDLTHHILDILVNIDTRSNTYYLLEHILYNIIYPILIMLVWLVVWNIFCLSIYWEE
jgi:hypothetical protein